MLPHYHVKLICWKLQKIRIENVLWHHLLFLPTSKATLLLIPIFWWFCLGQVAGRPVSSMSAIVLVVALLLSCMVDMTSAGCNGMCQACAIRYGCMTPAWGKCCTQFFQHNGRKRKVAASLGEDDGTTSHFQPAKSSATRPLKIPADRSMTSWARRIRPKRAAVKGEVAPWRIWRDRII